MTDTPVPSSGTVARLLADVAQGYGAGAGTGAGSCRLDGMMVPRKTAIGGQPGLGASLIGVVERGRIVGALWFCRGEYDEDEVRCRFRPEPAGRVVWDLGVHVNASHRLGRTFVRLWAAANQELRAGGAAWSLSRISAFNPSSIGAHERLGAVPMGMAVFLCLGALQLMVASRRPFVHISWGGAGPLLRLAAPTALR